MTERPVQCTKADIAADAYAPWLQRSMLPPCRHGVQMSVHVCNFEHMPCLHSLPALQTEARRVAAEALHAAMMDRTLSSDDKRAIQTQHVLMHRRHLFSCPKCWLQPYLCICNGIQRMQAATQLVVHVHHSEWCALCRSASRCGHATTIVVVCRFSSGPWLQRNELET